MLSHSKNYYEILEIPPSASQQEIKAAYKKLAILYHPDKNPDNKQAEEIFKLISEAYHTLSNSEKRNFYDVKIGLKQEINPVYYYKATQREEEQRQELRKAIFIEFFKRYKKQKEQERAEIQITLKKANFWIAIFLIFFFALVVVINILDIHDRQHLYEKALFYYHSQEFEKSDSIARLLCSRKPRNEKYALLHTQNLIAQKYYDIAYEQLQYSGYLYKPEFRFWWLVCRFKLNYDIANKTLLAIDYLERNGFKESYVYFWRALLKFELLADKQSICQDLSLAASLGCWQAEQYSYVCR
jgi:curved DNA-binding protein CbpA